MIRGFYFSLIGILIGLTFIFVWQNFSEGNFISIEGLSLVKESGSFINRPITILILGKPGWGYIGGENTDTIILAHFNPQKKKIYLISIPRDLLVLDEDGYLVKINSLYGDKKMDLLLERITEISGLRINDYIVIDLHLVKKIVDFVGGVDLKVVDPIIDAVTLFTLKPGYYHLNSDWAEFILRSRYAPEGDFARIKHQQEFILALWQKIKSLPKKDLINLAHLIFKNKNHWETNLDILQIYRLWSQIKDYSTENIDGAVLNFKTGLLRGGTFRTKRGLEYGILPNDDMLKYDQIREWIKLKIES